MSNQGRSRGAANASAVKVPKEIQVRKLKEAFKNADVNGEGRVDLIGFMTAINELALGTSEYTSSMLFMMSLPSAMAEQLTYMDFYKTLKKGCENYPGCSAQDVVGNLVLEYSNTSDGRKARNLIKQREREASIKREEEARLKAEAEARKKAAEKKDDIRDIAASEWASKDSLEVTPGLPDRDHDEHQTQSEHIPERKRSAGHTFENMATKSESSFPHEHRQFYEQPPQRRSAPPRAATVGHTQHFEDTRGSPDMYGYAEQRLSNQERMSDRGSERDGGYYEGSNQLRKAPSSPRRATISSYHAYSSSVNHLDMRTDHVQQSKNKTRSSLDFRNARQMGIAHPQQALNDMPPANSTHGLHISQDVREDMGSEHFNQRRPSSGSIGPRHQYSDSRATIPEEFMNQFDNPENEYQNYLSDVDDLLGSRESRQSFLHRRNRSVDRNPAVDLSHITNYLRSQETVLNARLISMEDNLRRQMSSCESRVTQIPIYTKNQIKSMINTETQLLNHEFKNIMGVQMKGFREILERDNTEDSRFQDESRKNREQVMGKLQVMTNMLDKVNRNSNNNRLEIGEISNNLAEMHDVSLDRGAASTQSGSLGGGEAMNSLLESHTDNIEACVDQAFTDVHMKLGSKIERVENILLAVAMKSGIQIPESPDWEAEHKKLADQHVKMLQQQQAALDAQSKELKRIKQDMQQEAMKLKKERADLQKFKQENQIAQKELLTKEENVSKALVKLKTERELIRSIKPSQSIDNVSVEHLGDIGAKLKEVERREKLFKDDMKKFQEDKDELVQTQEDKLFKVELKMKELQELKADLKAEKQRMRAKREQMKKDEQHVADCKNDLETIFDEIARKRNEVLNREQAVQKKADDLKKMEREVKKVLEERKDLSKAREKMNELQKKFVEDLKAKDQEIEAWKKQASGRVGDDQALESLRTTFENEKKQMVERHQMERKKLAQAAREKFRKDFHKEIENAKRDIDKRRRSQEKEKAALKEMKADLMHSVQEFEQQKKQSKREIRGEREALSKEKQRFKEMIEAATPRGKSRKKTFGSLLETGGEETSIDAFLEDLGPILGDSGGTKTTE